MFGLATARVAVQARGGLQRRTWLGHCPEVMLHAHGSPMNLDPGRARLRIDRLEEALCHLCGRRIPSAARHDEDGRVRVFACPLTFTSIAESVFNEIARYGRSSVSVTCRLLEAVRSVGSCVQRESDRRALLRQAAAIAGGVRESSFSEGDREQIARCYRAALTALHEP